MSTSDGQQLTRRQLRELRKTGQTPIITPDAAAPHDAPVDDTAPEHSDAVSPAEHNGDAASDQVEPAAVAELAADDEGQVAEAELAGEPETASESDSAPEPATATEAERELVEAAPAERPLTRRERRERGHTGAVPIAVPAATGGDDAAAADGDHETTPEPSDAVVAGEDVEETPDTLDAGDAGDAPDEASSDSAPADTDAVDDAAEGDSAEAEASEKQPEPESATDHVDTDSSDADEWPVVEQVGDENGETSRVSDADQASAQTESASSDSQTTGEFRPFVPQSATKAKDDDAPRIQTFDELLTKPRESEDSSGSGVAGSALILDELPGAAALSAPVTATGELLITRSHDLPQGFGSRGSAHGTTDGKEIDATLIDGEIPLASSPTPIAASSAVSTSKAPGEVFKAPVPERNHKLILTLGITAGGLGIAVVVSLGIAYALGAFN